MGDFAMVMFSTTNARRLTISALGALALTATCVGAAVAPADAAAVPATIDAWQDRVEAQIASRADFVSQRLPAGKRSEAVLAVRFTAEGDYAGADIARSTGSKVLDRHALQVAANIKYPPLPDSARGRPQTVAMRLYFGHADTAQQYADMSRDLESVRLADAGRDGSTTIAAK
jgi:TonB family protein